MYCRDSQSGYFFYRGDVNPGTPCNMSTGACVDHVCVPMMYEPGKTEIQPPFMMNGPSIAVAQLQLHTTHKTASVE